MFSSRRSVIEYRQRIKQWCQRPRCSRPYKQQILQCNNICWETWN